MFFRYIFNALWFLVTFNINLTFADYVGENIGDIVGIPLDTLIVKHNLVLKKIIIRTNFEIKIRT